VPTSEATKTKTTTKPTIEDLERRAKVAEAALLRGKADVLRLEDRMEKLAIERASVTVKSAGSKTEAYRLLEELDKERLSLERSISLATGTVAELETDLEAAETALNEARGAEQQDLLKAAQDASHKAKLEFEAALDRLAEAKKAVMRQDLEYQRVARVVGVATPWTNIEDRMGHRVYNRLRMPAPTPAWGIAPCPALARDPSESSRRGSAAEAGKGAKR
jgi:chromosome segregation ATPase